MPRRAKPPNPDRPQTLKEARRAYQKAGRSPSFTPAQLRAAERAAKADKRAKDIVAKEKRAKEAKRKREEQESKQREAQRILVQQGKLPEESLWGKVRASQPRLHNFFGAPQFVEASEEISKEHELHSNERAVSVERGDGRIAFPEPELTPPLKPILKSQKASPKARNGSNVEQYASDRDAPLKPSCQSKQETAHRDSETPEPLDAHTFVIGSQLLFELADDLALEAELNGHSLRTSTGSIPPSTSKECPPTVCRVKQPKKRRADDLTLGTLPPAKVARRTFIQISPPVIETQTPAKPGDKSPRAHKSSCLSHDRSHRPLEYESASQIEAMLGSQDFEEELLLSNKENIAPSRKALVASRGLLMKPNRTSPIQEKPPAPRFLSKPSNLSSSGRLSYLVTDRYDSVYNEDEFDRSEDEFGDDIDDEMLRLASQACMPANAPRQAISNSLSPKESTSKRKSEQESPLRLNLRDLPNSTPESFYDLDGVSDEVLAGLADAFSTRRNLGNEISPQKSSFSRLKSGRTIPWPTSTQLLEEEFCVLQDSLDEDSSERA